MPFDRNGVLGLSVRILQKVKTQSKQHQALSSMHGESTQRAAVKYRESLVIPGCEGTVSPHCTASAWNCKLCASNLYY